MSVIDAYILQAKYRIRKAEEEKQLVSLSYSDKLSLIRNKMKEADVDFIEVEIPVTFLGLHLYHNCRRIYYNKNSNTLDFGFPFHFQYSTVWDRFMPNIYSRDHQEIIDFVTRDIPTKDL